METEINPVPSISLKNNGFGAMYRCKNGKIVTIVDQSLGWFVANNGGLYRNLGTYTGADMSNDIIEHVGFDENFKREQTTE